MIHLKDHRTRNIGGGCPRRLEDASECEKLHGKGDDRLSANEEQKAWEKST